MGAFRCRCGYVLGRTPAEFGTSYFLVPDEDAEDLLLADSPRAGTFSRLPALHECPHCGRLHREDSNGIATYRRDDGLPRVWADLSVRDELGRVVLTGARSRREIADQKLLLRPPIGLTLYDDSGTEVTGEANFGLSPTGDLDETLWAVTLA